MLVDPDADRIDRPLPGADRRRAQHHRPRRGRQAHGRRRSAAGRGAAVWPDWSPRWTAPGLAAFLVAFAVYRSYLPAGAEHLDAALARPRSGDQACGHPGRAQPRLRDPATSWEADAAALWRRDGQGRRRHRLLPLLALRRPERGRGEPGRVRHPAAGFHALRPRQQRPAAVDDYLRPTTRNAARTSGPGWRCWPRYRTHGPARRGVLAASTVPEPRLRLPDLADPGRGRPDRADRMHAYAEKAMREASDGTTWTAPDEAYEASVRALSTRRTTAP